MRQAVLAAVLLALSSQAFAQVKPDTIYGDDDRLDLYQVKEAKVLALADSTVALFEASDVTLEGQTATLATRPYGAGMGLCKEERFWSQKNGAFCSGSLIGPDLLVTAGHCVTSEDSCKGTKFVFGFSIKAEGQSPDSVPASEVYGCAKLLGREQEGHGADWAIIRLDRKVSGHAPLKLGPGAVAKGDPLFVIGHPAGLPTKVAGGATVRDPAPNGYFVANLDTYGGNSGSAVFNAVTGQIEGILVRGENDFVYDSANQCRHSNVCTNEGCRGEDVTTIGVLVGQIPSGMSEALKSFTAEGPTLQSLRSMSGESSR
jgi:hypothetical protein